MAFSIKGILYTSVSFYNFITKIKLGKSENLRFLLAAACIDCNESVLDYCAGTGQMKAFLPENCNYSTVEMSDEFSAHLESKGITNYKLNPLEKMPSPQSSFDVVIMIISLYHFRGDRIDNLFEQMKKVARKKVIIVEEVVYKDLRESANVSLRTHVIQKISRFFIGILSSKYYVTSSQLFAFEELTNIFERHSLKIFCKQDNYIVGVWERMTEAKV